MSGISTDNRRRGSEEVNLMIAIDGELAELRSDHKMCENELQIIQKNFWFEKKKWKKKAIKRLFSTWTILVEDFIHKSCIAKIDRTVRHIGVNNLGQ